jgi:hypothetical protein
LDSEQAQLLPGKSDEEKIVVFEFGGLQHFTDFDEGGGTTRVVVSAIVYHRGAEVDKELRSSPYPRWS